MNIQSVSGITRQIIIFNHRGTTIPLVINIIEADILSVDLTDTFDAAFCMGNSFGYFTPAGMETFVQKVSASLKKGGRWIINTGVVAESFLMNFVQKKNYELPGLIMEISNGYNV